MKNVIPLLYLFFLPLLTSGQTTRLDSLKTAAAAAKDTAKVNLLLEMSTISVNSDPQQAIAYAQQAQKLAEAIRFPKGVAYANKHIGLAYYIQGQYMEVLNYWQKSLKTFQSIGDKTGESNLNSNIGAVYFNYGDYDMALEHYLASLKVAEQIQDKQRISIVLSNIGAVYEDQIKYNEALTYYLQALNMSRAIDFKPIIGTSLVNIGSTYLAKNEADSALMYLETSIPFLEEAGNTEKVAHAYENMGKGYTRKGNYAKALEYHQKALAKAQSVNAQLEIAESFNGLGETYSKQGKTYQALEAYTKARAIAQEIGSNFVLKSAYEGLAQAYASLSDFQNAYRYQTLLTGIKDTLYNTETVKKIGNLQTLYENEKQQAEIDLLTKDKELQQLELQRQEVVRNALLAGMMLILVLAFVLFRNNQIKQKANRLLAHRNEEIKHQKEEIESQRDNLEQTYNHLKNTQEQLVQSEKMASLGQLTAGVAHEINNPINFVSGGIDSLRTNFADIVAIAQQYFALRPDEDNVQKLRQLIKLKNELEVEELIDESEQLFKSIKNGANRTTEIVKSLRNFTRLDESNLKKADLHEGLDSTLVILANQLKGRIEVIKNYGQLEPITCYPGPLNQVFMNILTNAVQAIKETGTIWVQTYKSGMYAVIKIKDNGAGMSEEVKKHIFEPFFTTKDVGEGTGLGLSITYGIIEKHQGKIFVESQPGHGTEFTIQIPLSLKESSEKVEAMEV